MPTPGARAGGTSGQGQRCQPRPFRFARTWVLQAAPIVAIALYGAQWITVHADSGRGSAHTLWQSLALAENVLALLLRRRKPIGALAGILAVYLLTDLEPLTLLPLLLALLTVAVVSDHLSARLATAATAVVIVAMPYIHGAEVSIPGYALSRLAAVGLTVAAGRYLRARRETAGMRHRAERGTGECGLSGHRASTGPQ